MIYPLFNPFLIHNLEVMYNSVIDINMCKFHVSLNYLRLTRRLPVKRLDI